MPKKKSSKNIRVQDVTLNDSANAPKPVTRVKKSQSVTDPVTLDASWDELDEVGIDIVTETNEDGTNRIIYKTKWDHKPYKDIENDPGNVYPEIVWYLISSYVKPEVVGTFARINKATYGITKQQSFWRSLYYRHCADHPKLPKRLCIDNSFKVYGLRQRVIRALYHTYDIFVKRIAHQADQDSQPHKLVKRRCVNVWYCKGPIYWLLYFKFKKINPLHTDVKMKVNFIEELGRIDANPEEDCQVMQVTCHNFYEVPPLMGLTLTSVSVVLSQGFRYHRLHLGFNSGYHVSKDILPEHSVVLDTVVNIKVYDWWHPVYPHFDNKLPSNRDDESVPVLRTDFFSECDGEL